MNKFTLYIFSLIFLLCSCSREQMDLPESNCENGKIKVDFSVEVPDTKPSTKAMGDTPQLENLYLVVFDEAGYLAEYVKADPIKLEYATQNSTSYRYTVTLSLSDSPRTIHWIGNAPDAVQYGSEESVMMRLKTQGSKDAYWYRKVIDKVDAVIEGGESRPSDQLKQNLSNIPLIRNFAKIKLVDAADNFELESYTVVNTYNEGYIAAYDFSRGIFMEYLNGELQPKSHSELVAEGYNASTPSAATFTSLAQALNNRVGPDDSYYVYERERPLDTPPYIIAYGKYKYAVSKSYFKINLRDENDNYFPILRNFQYTLKLNAVYRDGYPTAEEAAASGGSGDISTALETESLIYMSDGSASLEVSQSDIVTTNSNPIEVSFAFYPDLINIFKGNAGEYNASIQIFKNDDYGIAGEAIYEISAPDYTKDIPTISITPTAPGDTPKSQSLTILGKYTPIGGSNQRSIQRKINITVMNPQQMTVQSNPDEIPNRKDWPFDVQVTIPAGLSNGMFPLDFTFESSALSISPDLNKNEYMTLNTGKSITGTDKPTFFYVKTLSSVDYKALPNINGKKTFTVHFKTINAASETDIYVANKFFYGSINDVRESYAQTQLGNYNPKYFKDLTFDPDKLNRVDNERVELSFSISDMPDDSKIIFLVDNIYPDTDMGENQLSRINATQYEYRPTSKSGPHKFKLIVPDANKVPTVTLKAHHFIDASKSIERVAN